MIFLSNKQIIFPDLYLANKYKNMFKKCKSHRGRVNHIKPHCSRGSITSDYIARVRQSQHIALRVRVNHIKSAAGQAHHITSHARVNHINSHRPRSSSSNHIARARQSHQITFIALYLPRNTVNRLLREKKLVEIKHISIN